MSIYGTVNQHGVESVDIGEIRTLQTSSQVPFYTRTITLIMRRENSEPRKLEIELFADNVSKLGVQL